MTRTKQHHPLSLTKCFRFFLLVRGANWRRWHHRCLARYISPSSTLAFVSTNACKRCWHPWSRTYYNTASPIATITTLGEDTQSSNNIIDPSGLKLNEHDDPFTLLSTLAATTLLQSDRRRDAVGKESGAQASSATNWIDEGCAFALRKALDKTELSFPNTISSNSVDVGYHIDKKDGTVSNNRRRDEEVTTWLRWMRSTPSPIIVDLSNEARSAANGFVSNDFLGLLNGNNAKTNDSDNRSSMSIGIANHAVNVSNNNISSSKMNRLRMEFLHRLQCQLIILPSGQRLQGSLREPVGSLIFAKLLCGGATRYRIIPSSTSTSKITINGGDDKNTRISTVASKDRRPSRRAGERTERKSSRNERVPSWVQYGGTERQYEAVDMGPAMILEWTLLPIISGKIDPDANNDLGGSIVGSNIPMPVRTDMMLQRLAWKPQNIFQFAQDEDNVETNSGDKSNESKHTNTQSQSPSLLLQGKYRNDALSLNFRSRIGGLGHQIDSIIRRVLDGRVVQPAEVDASGNFLSYADSRQIIERGGSGEMAGTNNDNYYSSLDDTSRRLSFASLEAEELVSLGLTPVKGLLLYGPPGCGKTALAREIARALRARAPKIVSAPELLDRWVGGSERLVRELFQDAEAELASVNGDASRSALHVIVIDEIDAVFRKRSSAEDSGEATRSSTVNQILSKLDGVEAISNVLLIGMTNRKELLDDALLRPGRLEVQIEIPLPNREGRREILQIHFAALRRNGRLTQPLCNAIDGMTRIDGDARGGQKRRAVKQATTFLMETFNPLRKSVFDLADDSVTGGFSGADLEGLVRCSGSFALSRARQDGLGIGSLLITLDDVKQALMEVKK